jgi:hypothetical protein
VQASAQSTGISGKNDTATVAIAGDYYPAPRGILGTRNAEDAQGQLTASSGAAPILMTTFGPMAMSSVDTARARAVAAPEAMPLMPYGPCSGEKRCKGGLRGADRDSYGRASYATGSTTVIYSQGFMRKGTGFSKDVYRDSLGANGLPPLSTGLSGWGSGPIAVAAAGKAVASANADSPLNGGMERRRLLRRVLSWRRQRA